MFERFWKVYPRKVGKLDAEKAWNQMARKYDVEVILKGAEIFSRACIYEERETQFIPYPASWLRAGRWMDAELQETIKPTEAELLVRKVETLDELRAWMLETHGQIPPNLALDINKARTLADLPAFMRNTMVPRDWRPKVTQLKVRA